MVEQFWFIIPLRSMHTAQDWEAVCANLRETVRSVLGQTDPRFKVIISCAEAPELHQQDDRVQIISGEYPVPTDFMGYALDKRAKKRAAGAIVREGGGGYVMLVDADDYISKDIVSYTLTNDNRVGYFVDEGYLYYGATSTIVPTREFYKKCGSSYVCHFTTEELPLDDDLTETNFDKFTNHRLALEVAAAQGKVLEPLPFPAAVYKLETGENLHNVHPSTVRLSRYKIQRAIKALLRRVKGTGLIPLDITENFGLKSHGAE